MKKLLLGLLCLSAAAFGDTKLTQAEYTAYDCSKAVSCKAVFRGYLPRIVYDNLIHGHFLSVVLDSPDSEMASEIAPAVHMLRLGANSWKGLELEKRVRYSYNPKSGKAALQFAKKKGGTPYSFFVDDIGAVNIMQAKVQFSAKFAQDFSSDLDSQLLTFLSKGDSAALFDVAFPLIECKKDSRFAGVINGVKIKALVDANLRCTVVMSAREDCFQAATKKITTHECPYVLTAETSGFGCLAAQPTGSDTFQLRALSYPGSHLTYIELPDGSATTSSVVNVTIDSDATARAYFGEYLLNVKVEGEGDVEVIPTGADSYTLVATPAQGYAFSHFALPGGEERTDNPYGVYLIGNTTVTAVFVLDN